MTTTNKKRGLSLAPQIRNMKKTLPMPHDIKKYYEYVSLLLHYEDNAIFLFRYIQTLKFLPSGSY